MNDTGDKTDGAAPATAQDAFERAAALHESNRPAEAEAAYRQALSLDPDHVDALCSLGLMRLQQDRPGESAALLRRAIEHDPDWAEAHHYLGGALLSLGAPADALACYDKALLLAPDYHEAVRGRGGALQALGRVNDAVECYETALIAKPDDAPTQLALATALEALDRHEEAFVRYRNAARLDANLAAPLSQALTAYGQRRQAVAQAGMQRLNRYIGAFLTNQANARMGVYPDLTSSPFHDPTRLPGAMALERAYKQIREEIEALAASEFQPEAENLKERGAWRCSSSTSAASRTMRTAPVVPPSTGSSKAPTRCGVWRG